MRSQPKKTLNLYDMPVGGANISENSRRIAKNTVLLYFRMFLLMIIGLFTTRIILRTLGFDDYGLFNAVGSVVALGNVLCASVASAISRYTAASLGEGDADKSGRIFSTSVVVVICMVLAVVLIMETVGLWFLRTQMDIPAGREAAAGWVFQCALGVFSLSLLSIPFNATIIAHERMSAFAWISVLEAMLKLGVALALLWSGGDHLVLYAFLLLGVAFIVRMTYGIYCRHNFAETRVKVRFEKPLFREMMSFAGWNFLGSGTFLLNTQGVNVATNIFFGVAMNAPRGIAGQIENIARQFVTNIMTAFNPQVTKSYVGGNREYSFELVCKASKYSGLLLLMFLIPYAFEADSLSLLLFGRNPAGSGLFSTLALLCVFVDMVFLGFVTLELATGDIRRYYIIISSVSILILPLTCLAFHLGAPAQAAYMVFAGVYVVVDALKLIILHSQTGFPVGKFLREVLVCLVVVAAVSAAVTLPVRLLMVPGWWRLAAVLALSIAGIVAASWFVALTDGERSYVRDFFAKFVR